MKAKKLLSTVLATGALTTALMAPAGAASLYNHNNYREHLGTWDKGTTWVGKDANDKASSITINGRHTRIYADIGHVGPSVLLKADHNDLGSLKDGLAWWQTWNDRITSFSKN